MEPKEYPMKILQKGLNTTLQQTNTHVALLILRVGAGSFMLTHGWGKFLKLIGDAPIQFADPIGIGEPASLALTVFAELLCSILLIFGLFTRFAVVPLLITMGIAAFIVHANDGFGKMEMALLYGFMYLTLLFTGPGKFSLDHRLYEKIKSE